MLLEKARWFNDAQAAAVLTIDDLANGWLDMDGSGPQPANDWGFACRGANSIYRYFENNILQKHPEIRFTVFTVFGRHCCDMVSGNYPGEAGDIFESDEFLRMLEHIVASGSEIGYHGHHHGPPNATVDPNTWGKEYEYFGHEKYREIMSRDLQRLHDAAGIRVLGGRSPRYQYDVGIVRMVSDLGFKWWSFDYTPYEAACGYRGDVFDFPTNVSGGVFTASPGSVRGRIREFLSPSPESRIEKMIRAGQVVTVTEHFQRSRPDGKRQTPTVFDDVDSLLRIFGILRRYDIWYATCSDIAHYRDSHDFTEIRPLDGGRVELTYSGRWDKPFLTVVSNRSSLRHIDAGDPIDGVLKRPGLWVYNDVPEGIYTAP